jgi:hypothetical protein
VSHYIFQYLVISACGDYAMLHQQIYSVVRNIECAKILPAFVAKQLSAVGKTIINFVPVFCGFTERRVLSIIISVESNLVLHSGFNMTLNIR